MNPRRMEPPMALTDREVSLRTARPVFLVGTAFLAAVAVLALAIGFTALAVACGVGFVVLFLVLALFVRQAGAPSGRVVRAHGDRYQDQWDRQLEIERAMRGESDAENRPRGIRPRIRIARRILFVSGAVLAAAGVIALVLGSPVAVPCFVFFGLSLAVLREIGRGRSRDVGSEDSDWLDGDESGDGGGGDGGDSGGSDSSDSTGSDSGGSDSGGGDSSSSNC